MTRANECPPGMDYELSMNMCCKDTPIYAGQKPTNVGGEKGRRQHNDESCFGSEDLCFPSNLKMFNFFGALET